MSNVRYRPVATSSPDQGFSKPSVHRVHKPKAPKQAIALALVLLTGGVAALTYGALHLAGHVVSKDGAGWAFTILGSIMFLPGAYVTSIAFLAWCGVEGFSYNLIPQ